jgi:peptidoglycan/LPS O-acetylase OafA/YrhL
MNFDLMRLIAALLVVISHTFALSGRVPVTIRGVEDPGGLGVSIFFVLSGYLVSASYLRDPRSYLVKRLLRIEPGLIASLIVTVVALWWWTTAPASEYWPAAAGYVVRNALLYPGTPTLPGLFAGLPYAGIVNGVLWTLRLEFTFYLVLMLIRANLRLLLVLVVGCAVVWLAVAVTASGPNDRLAHIAFLAGRNGMLFFAGAVIQVARLRISWWLAAVSVVAFPFVGPIALPTAVLGLARPGRLPADFSYGLYIYAFPIQQVLVSSGRLTLVNAVLAVLPFAAASWFLVERPALALKNKVPGVPEVPGVPKASF